MPSALTFALPPSFVCSSNGTRSPPSSLPSLLSNPNPLQGSLSCALQCQHFQTCSGCSHEWDLHKPPVLAEASDFFKSVGLPDFSFDSGSLWSFRMKSADQIGNMFTKALGTREYENFYNELGSVELHARGILWEWRCRAKLVVRGSSCNPLVGLYQEGTHNVVNIPHCRAHHPNINAAVELLKRGITLFDVLPYDEDMGTGELRYVQMVVTTHDTSLPTVERYKKGKVQVTLVWNSNNEHSPCSVKLNALSNFLWRNGGSNNNNHLIHSIWVNFQTSRNNVIFGNRWRHLLGERDLWERVGGVDICLAPSTFGQANTKAFDSLLKKLQKYVPYGASVADIYAGSGIIGLSLAATRKCRSVKCVEINKESRLSFEKSLGRLPRTVNSCISWHHADASIEPLYWLQGSDVVVVDPPRKGLHPSMIAGLQNLPSSKHEASNACSRSIVKVKEEKRPWVLRAKEASVCADSKSVSQRSQLWPKSLLYISCGWESFKKDCRSLLSDKAWHLEKAHAFNFFPGTDSMEVLAVFKSGPRLAHSKKKAGKKKKR